MKAETIEEIEKSVDVFITQFFEEINGVDGEVLEALKSYLIQRRRMAIADDSFGKSQFFKNQIEKLEHLEKFMAELDNLKKTILCKK